MGSQRERKQLTRIERNDPHYPGILLKKLDASFPAWIDALGNLEIMMNPKVAFFCSRRCPAEKIIKTFDLARRWRDDGLTVISGFHSPIEKECLDILLRGTQPVIICPARGIQKMRIPREWKESLDQGRLLILSLFQESVHRATKETAYQRNRFVAALADEVHFIHAEANGQIEALQKHVSLWFNNTTQTQGY